MRYTIGLLCVLLSAASPAAFGGSGPAVKSSYATVYLNATLNERLSVVSATPSVSFSLEPQSVNLADRPITITTSWNLNADRTAVEVSAFFDDPASALAAQGNPVEARISSAEIFGRTAAGTPRSFTPFLSMVTNGTPHGGLEIFRQELTPGVNDFASRTDAVELKIDLTSLPRLAAGHYQGVLTLVAQAY